MSVKGFPFLVAFCERWYKRGKRLLGYPGNLGLWDTPNVQKINDYLDVRNFSHKIIYHQSGEFLWKVVRNPKSWK